MSTLGTAISGLLVYQRALATTSHNIANATTEGYSRQRVELSARNPQVIGGSYVGTGVQVSSIRRLQDDLVNAQLRVSLSDSVNGEVRAAYAERADRLLADESTGLMPPLEKFFSAAQDVSSDPTAIPARTVMLNEAETLVERFGVVNGQLEEQRTMANKQIRSAVDEVNQYARSLAEINSQIVTGSTAGSPANDLLDRRDVLLNKIAEKIDVSITTQDDGAMNVFIGNGQALVMGSGARQLVAQSLSGDPVNLDIGIKTRSDSEPANITRFMSGGEIGALLETRTNILDTAQNELGLIGLNLATGFNQQNRLGLDLDGELGEDIFTLPRVDVAEAINNSLSGAPTVTISDVTQLSPSDYRLSHNGTTFQLTRLPGKEVVTLVPDATDPSLLVGDGLSIDTTAIAGAAAGDSWLIQPTRNAASGLSVAMTDPAHLAAASGALADASNTGETDIIALRVTAAPPTSDTYLPAAVVANAAGDAFNVVSPQYDAASGNARIESFSVLDPRDADLLTPVSITFDAATNQFDVDGERFSLDTSGTTTINANGWELKVRGTPDDGSAFTIGVTPTAVATPQPATTTIAGNGWELDIRGTPDGNDLFTVDLSKGREGDNRNMLAMGDLQDARLVEGRTTFQGGYNGILAEVGTQTRQAQITRDSSAVLLEQAQGQREAISGVNLDEEAANLIRYQQAYEAAAQVIAVSNSLFDTLLAAVRR